MKYSGISRYIATTVPSHLLTSVQHQCPILMENNYKFPVLKSTCREITIGLARPKRTMSLLLHNDREKLLIARERRTEEKKSDKSRNIKRHNSSRGTARRPTIPRKRQTGREREREKRKKISPSGLARQSQLD